MKNLVIIIFFFFAFLTTCQSYSSENLEGEQSIEQKPVIEDSKGASEVNANPTIDEPLFTVVNEILFDQNIDSIAKANSFIVVSSRLPSNDGFLVSAFDFSANKLWEIKYDSVQYLSIITSEFGDEVLVRMPIVKEDEHPSSLRDCKNLFFETPYDIIAEFTFPCFDLNLTGSDRFIVSSISTNDGQDMGIYDVIEKDFVEFSNKRIGGGKLLTQNEITVVENNRLDISRFDLSSIPIGFSETSVEIGLADLAANEQRIVNDYFVNQSNKVTAIATRVREEYDNQITHKYELFFMDEFGKRISYFDKFNGRGQMLFISDSTAIIYAGSLPTNGGSFQSNQYSKELSLFNYRTGERKFLSKEIDKSSNHASLFEVNKEQNWVLINHSLGMDDPCKTDIKKINLNSQKISCPDLFDNYEALYHPKVFQNSSNFEEFIFLNSLKGSRQLKGF